MFCSKQAATIKKTFGTPDQLKKWMEGIGTDESVSPYDLCFLDLEWGQTFKSSGYVIASPVMLNLWITK